MAAYILYFRCFHGLSKDGYLVIEGSSLSLRHPVSEPVGAGSEPAMPRDPGLFGPSASSRNEV